MKSGDQSTPFSTDRASRPKWPDCPRPTPVTSGSLSGRGA